MGSAFTLIGLDPIPHPNDAVLIPSDFSLYAAALDHKIVHWAQDQADRDVLYAAALAPVLVASPTAVWLKISGSGGSSVWRTLWGDSGNVTSGISAGPDFQYVDGYVRKQLNSVFFTIGVQRKTSNLSLNAYNHPTSPGNLVGDPICMTLPAGYRPDHVVEVPWRGFTCDGCAEVNTDGTVELISGTPGGDIDIDDVVIVSGTFMVP